MSKNLVIVESPAKAKTIEKFLGKDFIVKSSIGHIRDMPKKNMGIDIANSFKPTYEVSSDKKKVVAELRRIIKTVDKVWLATDEDREGEAIAWHLAETLNLDKDTPRIVFHEITKSAITKAVKNPRVIDKNLVDAQQARRILDRIVGFEISPVLWQKVSGARSAGRVQSPVMRLVVEREREIQSFIPTSSFKVSANLLTKNNNTLPVKLKNNIDSFDEAQKFALNVSKSTFKINDITKKPASRSPKAPFITSTLQQEASSKLGFSVKQTMTLAQNLYRKGFITYMRTDSVNLSEEAISQAKIVIETNYGKEYIEIRRYKSKDVNAQEAHEAIRPTDLSKVSIREDDKEVKLYKLIYKRTLASLMAKAKLEKTIIDIDISNTDENFIAEGETLTFDGFLRVYNFELGEDSLLPNVDKKENLTLESFLSKESFSRAKPRYTEASLVKKIETMGIGRPSTFATMVSTVQDRNYVTKETREGTSREYRLITIENNKPKIDTAYENTGAEKHKLFPTDVAYLLTDFLVDHFDNMINYDFTANIEKELDEVALSKRPFQDVLEKFYKEFHPKIELAMELSRDEIHKVRELGIDPKSSKPITARFGKYGAYVQIGNKEDEEKPTFSAIRGELSIETITLDEALELFKMPRTVGEDEKFGKIKANYGRFGPYIQYGKKYVSLKEVTPEKVSLQEALELIVIKEELDAKRVIKTFDDSDIQVLNGRFGPYIWNGKKKGKGQKNITIKKIFGEKKKPIDLTLKQCEDAISGKLKPKVKPKTKTKKKTTKK
jgi:DNA topoisomerase-1